MQVPQPSDPIIGFGECLAVRASCKIIWIGEPLGSITVQRFYSELKEITMVMENVEIMAIAQTPELVTMQGDYWPTNECCDHLYAGTLRSISMIYFARVSQEKICWSCADKLTHWICKAEAKE